MSHRSNLIGFWCLACAVTMLGFPSDKIVSAPVTSFVYPVLGPRMSSAYGKRTHPIKRAVKHHDGVDLAAPRGAPIRAIADGTVVFADPHGGYGKLIVIEHRGGMTSHYGHCEKISVNPGSRIKAGQIIGTVGSTGKTTGPHLHFEVRLKGVSQDPERFIPGLAAGAAG